MAQEGQGAALSSAPCTPAPGRRIIIIRCNKPAPVFDSFDGLVPFATPSGKNISPKGQNTKKDASPDLDSQPTMRRRWNSMFKSVFSATGNPKPATADEKRDSGSDDNSTTGTDTDRPSDENSEAQQAQSDKANIPPLNGKPKSKQPHQPAFFKFSLEWMDRPQWANKNRRLFAPCLPVAAQSHMQDHQVPASSDSCTSTTSESGSDEDSERNTPPSPRVKSDTDTEATATGKNPSQEKAFNKFAASKYAGRALAEWAFVVSECDSFFSRRREEGVPTYGQVETPTLGVESFRK